MGYHPFRRSYGYRCGWYPWSSRYRYGDCYLTCYDASYYCRPYRYVRYVPRYTYSSYCAPYTQVYVVGDYDYSWQPDYVEPASAWYDNVDSWYGDAEYYDDGVRRLDNSVFIDPEHYDDPGPTVDLADIDSGLSLIHI